jgi:hypothetical protein
VEQKEREEVMNRCVFCGEILNEQGICPNAAQHFKPMCLNCIYCSCHEDGCICDNDENRNDAVQKLIQSYEGGYKITSVELAPIPLKDPTKKCKRYELDCLEIIEQMSKMYK